MPGPTDSNETSALPGGYRQLCVIAAALDVVGARWSLLLLRDLLRSPLRYTDLSAINPGISPTLLASRLRQLEADGIVERRTVRGPGKVQLYAITDWARPTVRRLLEALADFGATVLEHDPPTEEDGFDPVTALAQQMRLNSHYVLARGSELEGYFLLDLSGWQNHIVIGDRSFESSDAPPVGRTPDATAFFFPPTVLMRLMGRNLTTTDAEAQGLLTVDGDRDAMLELIELLSFA